MHYFTIRDIENLCGIKAHTLRIWEQRYTFFSPQRKSSKHRIYDNEDLKQLLRISFLYHNGWKISRIAALSPEEILNEVQKLSLKPVNKETYVLQLLESALEFDEPAFIQLLDKLIEQLGFETCITEICYPYLQRIGQLWVTDHVVPAQEHFSSYLIQHKIIAETDKLPPATSESDTILLFTPQDEHHELPLLYIHYLLRKNGWQTIYMGANVRIAQIKQIVGEKEVQFLFLHLITNLTKVSIDDYVEDVCTSFREQTIVASGSSIFSLQRHFLNLILLRSDKEIINFIERKH
ncbi:MAG: MerR family transcriptional regulator, partial [Flavisolibacter sp.]|nr:MerR family transcriptional regulator [Flavisolibacter sp.]